MVKYFTFINNKTQNITNPLKPSKVPSQTFATFVPSASCMFGFCNRSILLLTGWCFLHYNVFRQVEPRGNRTITNTALSTSQIKWNNYFFPNSGPQKVSSQRLYKDDEKIHRRRFFGVFLLFDV